MASIPGLNGAHYIRGVRTVPYWLHGLVVPILVDYKTYVGLPAELTTSDLRWINREVEKYVPLAMRMMLESKTTHLTREMTDYLSVLVESDLGTS